VSGQTTNQPNMSKVWFVFRFGTSPVLTKPRSAEHAGGIPDRTNKPNTLPSEGAAKSKNEGVGNCLPAM
jgi:hypothetical protein